MQIGERGGGGCGAKCQGERRVCRVCRSVFMRRKGGGGGGVEQNAKERGGSIGCFVFMRGGGGGQGFAAKHTSSSTMSSTHFTTSGICLPLKPAAPEAAFAFLRYTINSHLDRNNRR